MALKDVVESYDFRAADPEQQRAFLADNLPGFADGSKVQQDAFMRDQIKPVGTMEAVGHALGPVGEAISQGAQKVAEAAAPVGEQIAQGVKDYAVNDLYKPYVKPAVEALQQPAPGIPEPYDQTMQRSLDAMAPEDRKALDEVAGRYGQSALAGLQGVAGETTNELASGAENLAKVIPPYSGEGGYYGLGGIKNGLIAMGQHLRAGAQFHQAEAAARAAAGLQGPAGEFVRTLAALPPTAVRMLLESEALGIPHVPGIADKHAIRTALTFMADAAAQGRDARDVLIAGGQGALLGQMEGLPPLQQAAATAAETTAMGVAQGAPLPEALAQGIAYAPAPLIFNGVPRDAGRVVPRYEEFKSQIEQERRQEQETAAQAPGQAPEIPQEPQAPSAPETPRTPEVPAGPEAPPSGGPGVPPETGQPEPTLPTAPVETPAGATAIALPGGEALPAHYEWRDAGDLIASHDPWNFSPRADYGGLVNERAYHREKTEQMGVVRQAQTWDPRFIYNETPTATDGPPVILPDGRVLGGNKRTMVMQRVPGENLQQAAIAYGQKLGLDPAGAAGMQRPVPVRVLDEAPQDLEGANVLIRRLNESFTHTVNPGDRGVANARSLSQPTLDHVIERVSSLPDDAKEPTIRGVLRDNRELVKSLEADGIIRTENRSQYVTTAGTLTEEGVKMVEDALLGRVVKDPEVLNSTPDGFRNHILRSIPHFLSVEKELPELGFGSLLEDAVRREVDRQARKMKMEDYVAQGDLENPLSAQTAALMKLLQRRKGTEVRKKFARFAKDIREAMSDQALMFGERVTVEDAFKRLLGVEMPEVPHASESYRAYAQKTGPGIGPRIPLERQDAGGGPPGQHYIGQRVADLMPAANEMPPGPIRPGDLIREVATKLKLPIQEGRLKLIGTRFAKNVSGFFLPRNELTRVKTWGDFQTAIHEVAHALADRHKEFANLYSNRVVAKLITQEQEIIAGKRKALDRDAQALREMLNVSYDRTLPWEGWAESIRLWATQGDYFAKVAPTAKAVLEETLNKPGLEQVKKVLENARDRMHAYFKQGPLGEALARISGDFFGGPPTEPPASSAMSAEGGGLLGHALAAGSAIRERLFEAFHRVAEMEQDLFGRILPDGSYETFRRYRGVEDLIHGMQKLGFPIFTGRGQEIKWSGRGLMDILAPVARSESMLRRAMLYTVGRRARELSSLGIETPFREDNIRAMLDVPKEDLPAFAKFHDDLVAHQDGVLKFARDTGLISRDDYNRIKSKHKEYSVAFFRDMSETLSMRSNRRQGPGGNPLARMNGSSRDLSDSIRSLALGPGRIVQAAFANMARRQIFEEAQRAAGGGRWLQELPKEDKQVTESLAALQLALRRRFRELGLTYPSAQVASVFGHLENMGETDLSWWRHGTEPPRDGMVERIMIDGKPRYVKVFDQGLWRAMQGLNRPDTLFKALNLWRRFEQAAITLFPGFQAGNLPRDLQELALYSHSATGVMREMLGALWDALRTGPDTQAYIANGGGGATFREFRELKPHDYVRHSQWANRTTADMARLVGAEVLWGPRDIFRLWQHVTHALELAPSVATYRAAVRRGETPTHAAFRGRNSRVDFSQQGSWDVFGNGSLELRGLMESSKFLSASAAGMESMYSKLVKNENGERGRMLARVVAMTAATTAIHALMRTANPAGPAAQDEYNRTKPEARDRMTIFYLPNKWLPEALQDKKNGYRKFTIPLPYDIGVIFAAAKRSLDRYLDGANPDRALGLDLANLIMSNSRINPPLFFEEYQQQTANRNWNDQPIVPERLLHLPPGLQADERTNPILAATGRFAAEHADPRSISKNNELVPDWIESPMRAQHVLDSFFGGWAAMALGWMAHGLGLPMPAAKAADIPALNRFVAEPGRWDSTEGDFYEISKNTESLQAAISMLRRSGQTELAKKWMHTPGFAPEGSGAAELFNRVRSTVSDVNKEMRETEAQRGRNLTQEQVDERLDKLRERKRAAMRSYLNFVEKARSRALETR